MNIYKKMIKCALESQKKAYTPYSNFNVGASVLTDSGKIYECGRRGISDYHCKR